MEGILQIIILIALISIGIGVVIFAFTRIKKILNK